MTHRFFVGHSQFSGEMVTFTEAQSHQLARVLRLRAGQHVHVFDGASATDLVVELVSASEGRVIGQTPHAPEPRTCLHAYPALLQRDKFEVVLQKLTELGVAAITPVLTARGLVRSAPDEARYVRWRAIVTEAAEQSGRGRIPALCPAQPIADALRFAPGAKLVAYEGERELSLHAALLGRPTEVSVFVGPEGGFSLEEVQSARSLGASLITLGPRVLRAETASPVLAALVLYELCDLSGRTEHDE
jgi:16S rRNA (uracil1498-N3)-methyltransferase